MSNLIPISKRMTEYVCGNCDNEFFILVEKNNKMVAICSNCESPLANIYCGCLKDIE